MEWVGWLSEWFWDQEFWFPHGVTWKDLQTTSTEKLPDFFDLWYPILYAFVIIVIRFLFEWLIARPLGSKLCGIEDTHSVLSDVVRYFRAAPVATPVRVSSHHKCCDGDAHQRDNSPVCLSNGDCKQQPEQPRRRRTKSGSRVHLVPHKSILDKFAESCWRCAYYSFIFFYGVWALWDKPWLADTENAWHGWPSQAIAPEIWWYYVIEAAFYWALAFSQFFDVHRKDFWVNFVHHIATILLIYLSWACNFVRIGTLVLVIHDAADSWMEGAKMARYCKKDLLCNGLFGVFTIVWFITRLGLFPFIIIYSTMVEAVALVGFSMAFYIFNSLLLLLEVLHIFWSVMILNILIKACKDGAADDIRSDDEDEKEE